MRTRKAHDYGQAHNSTKRQVKEAQHVTMQFEIEMKQGQKKATNYGRDDQQNTPTQHHAPKKHANDAQAQFNAIRTGDCAALGGLCADLDFLPHNLSLASNPLQTTVVKSMRLFMANERTSLEKLACLPAAATNYGEKPQPRATINDKNKQKTATSNTKHPTDLALVLVGGRLSTCCFC